MESVAIGAFAKAKLPMIFAFVKTACVKPVLANAYDSTVSTEERSSERIFVAL